MIFAPLICRRCGNQVLENHTGVTSTCFCPGPPLLEGACEFCLSPTREGLFSIVSSKAKKVDGGKRHNFAHKECYNLDIFSKEDFAVKQHAANPRDETWARAARLLGIMGDLICSHHKKRKEENLTLAKTGKV